MFDIPDDELTNEFPEDISKLKALLNAAGYDASDKDIEWAWVLHSLDWCSTWTTVGDAALRWLLQFLEPEN